MAEAELRNMIMNFRVSDLQVLLGFAGRNKTGKKQELQSRALDLLIVKSHAVDMKVRELHNRRYHHQLVVRQSNYEMQDRVSSERPAHAYETHVNNNYTSTRINPSVRPTLNHQGPSSSYSSSSNKTFLPPLSNTSMLPHYNKYVDVKFKELPFYDILYILMRPSSLPAEPTERYQETNFYFTLTPQQAQDIAFSRHVNGHYECQVMLRFCLLDTSCEQDDNFPPNLGVKVNSKAVTLPNPIPTNRPGIEPKRPSKPVNITSVSKLSPTVTNIVTVSWSSTYGRSYAATLFIVRQLSSHTLLQRLKNNGIRNPDYTTALIKEKLQQGQDADIATTSLLGSLICPLGKIKMNLPCRAVTCNHLQCFDAFLFIQMNEKKPKWICPVCDKTAPFRTLAIDGLFIDIASKVPSDCTEVQFNEDGSWVPISPIKLEKDVTKTVESLPKKNAKPVEIVDILSDSDSADEFWSCDLDTQEIATACAAIESENYPPAFDNSSEVNPNSYSQSTTMPSNSVPVSLSLSSDVQNGSLYNLPDLNSHTDVSMPSMSSSSPGLSSSSFPQISFMNDSPFYSSSALSTSLPDQMTSSLSRSQSASYTNLDIISLLDIPETEQPKLESKENSTPDVISLE